MKNILLTAILTTAGSLCLIGCDPPAPLRVPETTSQTEVAAPDGETELVEAKPGVTGKGQYGQGSGEKPMDIITVPVGTYFAAKEAAVFDIQIPHAMTLYKAMNDNKAPDSQDAFMRDIVRANQIVLPQLPEGHEYVYDPETEKLMVRKPK